MPSEAEYRELATVELTDAGREISQQFGTLNSSLALATGTLGALLAVIGGGELFNHQTIIEIGSHSAQEIPASTSSSGGLPQLSNVSLLIIGLAFPLLLRFYVRATISYQQLERFNLIRKSCWQYLAHERTWHFAQRTIAIYHTDWKSPISRSKLFWGSAKYGFVLLFAIYLVILGWALVTADDLIPRLVSGLVVLGASAFEGRTLRDAEWLKGPSSAELAELIRLKDQTPS